MFDKVKAYKKCANVLDNPVYVPPNIFLATVNQCHREKETHTQSIR